ncbi:hypothetical protein, partial [Bacillus altitudinis]|uniref:hypothetical protein n=1 Tax=Bacillus altitudinis TaxID=293387 RepID=UPI001C92C919
MLLADEGYEGEGFEIELGLWVDWVKEEEEVYHVIEALDKVDEGEYGDRDDQGNIEFSHLRVGVIGERGR